MVSIDNVKLRHDLAAPHARRRCGWRVVIDAEQGSKKAGKLSFAVILL